MGVGIMICGLNGCGKSTLGKALADELGFHFIDIEFLYFNRLSDNDPYANSRSRDEVASLLIDEMHKFDNFVFAAVKGDYGDEILSHYDYVILMEVPKEIRLQRVRNRSYQKLGERMLIGGDLYDQEERFFRLVESRSEDYAAKWVRSLNAPVITVDGTKSIEENVAYIIKVIHKYNGHQRQFQCF